ncbi:MAG TPA: tetratricopeptide repeat protein [Polyangiaceae bacterium]|nr:tetratricopeptide repeat protein [Polyangiaceae bacterium]
MTAISWACAGAPAGQPQAPVAVRSNINTRDSSGSLSPEAEDAAAPGGEAARENPPSSGPPDGSPHGAARTPGPAGSANGPGTRAVPGGLSRGGDSELERALSAGDAAYFDGELPRARAEYERALKLAPQDLAPQLGLLRVELAGLDVPLDYAAAPNDARLLGLLKRLDMLKARDPGYGPTELERGRVLLILGRAAPALQALERGVATLPKDPEAHSALGVALLATGRAAEALPRFRKAYELEPANAERARALGTAELLTGNVDRAIAAYSRAVALAPTDARAHSDLGSAYLAQNAPVQAVPELQRAVDLDPTRATFRSNLAYAALLVGDNPAAAEQARHAIRLDPKLASAHLNLGTALARQGRYDDAERAFRRALELDPSDPRAKTNLEELQALRRQKPQ